MNRLIKIIFLAGVICGWSLCFAQNPIFLPVDDEKAREVSEYNKYFLMDQLYFAKRHRIVEIDVDLLKRSKIITLNFFDDVNIPVVRASLKKGAGSGYVWDGQMQFATLDDIFIPPESEEVLREQGITRELLLEQVRGVTFYIYNWDVDNRTGEAVYSAISPKGALSNKPLDASDLPDFTRKAFSSVSGKVTFHPTQQIFFITSLKFSPKYHVVYEYEHKKSYMSDVNSQDSVRVQSGKKRYEEHTEFIERLPVEEDKKIKGDM